MMRYSLRIIDNHNQVVVPKEQLRDLIEFVDKSRTVYRKIFIANIVAIIFCVVALWFAFNRK